MYRSAAATQHHGTLLAVFAVACLAFRSAHGQEGCKPSARNPQVLEQDLPPQPLVDALECLAKVTGIQLIYRAALGVGKQSPGASAGVGVKRGLNQLLVGSGLTWAFVNEHTVTILQEVPEQKVLAEAAVPGQIVRQSAQRGRPGAVQVLREDELIKLDDVTITGTHLKVPPVGSLVQRADRLRIDRGGFATIEEVLESFTLTFRGPSAVTRTMGSRGGLDRDNTTLGAGVDLRGLGAGGTLVLLNGRRLVAGGSEGRFVDVLGIPLSAVERIEILPDGASAVYGADAIGGVVNVILRDNYEGAETQLRRGAATQGDPAERLISQTFGTRWPGGHGLISFEYFHQDSLPAAARIETAHSDLRPLGGDNWDTIEGNPGTLLVGSQTWALPRVEDGRSATVADLAPGVNWHNRNAGRDVQPDERRSAIVATASQDVGAAELFGDLLLSRRDANAYYAPYRGVFAVPSSNPHYINPTGGTDPVSVAYSFAREWGPEKNVIDVFGTHLSLGAVIPVASEWTITPAATHSRSRDYVTAGPYVDPVAMAAALADPDPRTAFNLFGGVQNPTTLAAIADIAHLERRSALMVWSITAHGALAQLPTGQVTAAAGIEQRDESLVAHYERDSTISSNGEKALQQRVRAVFGEVLLPLVTEDRNRRIFPKAQLSLAVRHEDHSSFGASTPRLGVEVSLTPSLKLRGAMARSIKAPHLADRDETFNGVALVTQIDPNAGNEPVPAMAWFGGNRDLGPESASTWTLGAGFNGPATSVDLTWFHTVLHDGVDRPQYSANLIADPFFARFVTREPSAAQRDSVCSRVREIAARDACREDTPIAAILDLRVQNFALVRTSGLDFTARHSRKMMVGEIDLSLTSTFLHDYSRRSSGAPLKELLDTAGYPLDWRARTSATWSWRNIELTGAVHYSDDYRDTQSNPPRRVGSWTTADLQARHRLSLGALRNVEIAINAQNIFDEAPPFLNSPQGVAFDAYHADVTGRFWSALVRAEW